jgi:hypothetical protein
MVKNRAGAIVKASQIKVNSNGTIALVDGSPIVSDQPKIIGCVNSASYSEIAITQWTDCEGFERRKSVIL